MPPGPRKPDPRKPDPNSGSKERNEYIPSFISKKPFYASEDPTSSTDDYLEHQRLQQGSAADRSGSLLANASWYDRGQKAGPAATKFRKGACDNCGAMGHTPKECLSRPRKKGARWTGLDIQADEKVHDLGKRDWDAKRDRWNGFNAKEYDAVIQGYNEAEEAKRKAKEQGSDGDGPRKKLKMSGEASGDEESETEQANVAADHGDRYEEETDMGRQQSTSTRNLRLREDTAKYLLNLDLESARYDPKTRSMVRDSGTSSENLSQIQDKGIAALIAEEGFVRKSGDAAAFEAAQRAAWDRAERGDRGPGAHLQANPTGGALAAAREAEQQTAKREAHQKALKEKYGVQDSMGAAASRAGIASKSGGVTENSKFVEYDERGRIKNKTPAKRKSVYAEDVLINNHTSVWGSWWCDFKWGYACCHSTVRNSYCTGEEGKKAAAAEKNEKGLLEAPADGEKEESIQHEAA